MKSAGWPKIPNSIIDEENPTCRKRKEIPETKTPISADCWSRRLTHSALDPTADTGIMRFNAAVAARADLVTIIIPVLKNGGVDGLAVSVKRTV